MAFPTIDNRSVQLNAALRAAQDRDPLRPSEFDGVIMCATYEVEIDGAAGLVAGLHRFPAGTQIVGGVVEINQDPTNAATIDVGFVRVNANNPSTIINRASGNESADQGFDSNAVTDDQNFWVNAWAPTAAARVFLVGIAALNITVTVGIHGIFNFDFEMVATTGVGTVAAGTVLNGTVFYVGHR